MGDFFAFRKMITPAVIQIFFWLGVIVCVIAGLGILSSGETLAAPLRAFVGDPDQPDRGVTRSTDPHRGAGAGARSADRADLLRAPDGALPDLRIPAGHRAEPGPGDAPRALSPARRAQRRTNAGCTQAIAPPESSTRALT